METCAIFIKTVADDTESVATFKGECTIGETLRVCYVEKGARVGLTVDKDGAIVERSGDYGLRLKLVPMQTTKGSISLGGYVGEVETETETVEYQVRGDTVFLKLGYALVTGNEKQKMKLFITIRKGKNDGRDEEDTI